MGTELWALLRLYGYQKLENEGQGNMSLLRSIKVASSNAYDKDEWKKFFL